MNRKVFCLAAVPALATGVVALNTRCASAIELVKAGQPRASIVVGKDASPQVRRAAQTLQGYLQKSSGALLPIVSETSGAGIYLAAKLIIPGIDRKKIDADGFVLAAVDGKKFVIAGGSDWGTEFGVNDFLERYLGVRWLFPGELGTDVPRLRNIEIPDRPVVQSPVFLSRQLSPLSNIMLTAPDERWGRINRAKPRIRFHHNLLHLFPASKYARTHPEFYPIINGKRYLPKDAIDESWQPNLSAPGIVDAAVAEIEDYFRKHPEETSFSLGMNDSNNWDESPESRARRSGRPNYLGFEDVSDDYFAWANEVVEKVLRKYPDKWFGMLAYHGIVEPPTRVKVNPRIVPFLTYDRMRWDNPKLREEIQNVTQRWRKASPLVGWYDYAYGMSYLLPRTYPHTMKNYLSWGAAHGVKFSYAEIYPNWGEGPKPWVFTRLLWNPNQNVDALLNDWYTHCAGPKAAPSLKAYYAVWEKFWTVDVHKTNWSRSTGEFLRFDEDPSYILAVPQSYITKSDAAMKTALKLADTPQRRARVAKLAQMWEFYKTSILAYQETNALNRKAPQTEEEALAVLDRTEHVMQLVQRRRKLVAAFRRDPLFKLTAKYVDAFPTTDGKNWGTSLLWQLLPWIEKSPQVKTRLQEIAHRPGGDLGEQANFLTLIANGNFRLLTSNPSFDAGSDGWGIWDKSGEGPQYHKGDWLQSTAQAYSGEYSFLIRGLSRGGLMQSIPYQPGKYFAIARNFVPQGSKAGTAIINLEALNEKGEVLDGPFAITFTSISIQPGAWGLTVIPFTLPENKGGIAKSFRMHVLVDGFNPDGEIYLDDVGIYRLNDR